MVLTLSPEWSSMPSLCGHLRLILCGTHTTFPEGSAQGVWPLQFPGRAGPDVPEIVAGPPEPPPSPWSTAQQWMEFQDGVMAVELAMSAWLCPINPEVASASHFPWLSLKCRVLGFVPELSILRTSCYMLTDCVSIFKLEEQRPIPVNFSDCQG